MKLRYESLSAAVLVALVFTVVISTASASYTASSYPTTATAESAFGNDVFKTEAGNVECKSHFESTVGGPSTSVTVKAKYTSCKAFGFFPEATVSMGSCDFLFTEPLFLGTTEEGKTREYRATVHQKCTSSTEPISISAGVCKATVGEQPFGGHVIIKVTTVTGDLDVQATLTGIKYTVTEDGFGCPFSGTGVKEGGTYNQGLLVTGKSTNGATIDVDGPSAGSGKEFTASTYPTTGTGESALGNDVLKTEAGNVECKSHYSSTLSGKSSTLTVTPTYTECKAFGFLEALLKMNGCDYLLNSATAPSSDVSTSKLDISCGSEVISITAGTCTMLIGPQKGLSKVTTTNNTAAGDISIQAAVTGIEYFVSRDAIGCPFGGTGRKTGAELNQASAITFDSTNGAIIDVG